MRIILIGFMGSGKSTVARILGSRMSLPVIEMDDLTARAAGETSVARLIETRGEAVFRAFETQVLEESRANDNCILSTGGGAIINDAHRPLLETPVSTIVFLKTSFETISKRVDAAERPLLRDSDNARRIFDSRLERYEAWAAVTVETDSRTPDEVADEIIRRLEA